MAEVAEPVAIQMKGLAEALLLYDLRGYATEAGQAASLVSMPLLWAVVVGAAIGITLRLARGPFGWLGAAVSVVLALPRLFVYDVTYLMVGTPPPKRPD